MKELPSALMRVLREHHINLGDGSLLALALTHKSWVNERKKERQGDNERLEFLGDAVVGLAIAEELYKAFPNAPEGDLARMRAAIVCEPSLARAGERLGLGQALKLGVGEERSGGRKRVSLSANTYEAVIGAIFLMSGWETVRKVVLGTLSPELDNAIISRAPADPKSRLQELLQARSGQIPSYRLVGETGPDHAKRFFSEVVFEGKVLGRGGGTSKRASEQAAAKQALENLDSSR